MVINNKIISKIGVVIADEQEYLPFVEHFSKYPSSGGKIGEFKITRFNMDDIELVAIHCGIGKVASAAAATALIYAEGVEFIINEGLSGGVKAGISSIIVGKRFVEHDFDLTPIGYAPGEKGSDGTFIEAGEALKLAGKIKSADYSLGTFVCGDCFVASEEKSKQLIELFDADACDMESAAIAFSCKKAGVPFFSIRKISDGANEESCDTYNEMNNKQEKDLAVLIEEIITG